MNERTHITLCLDWPGTHEQWRAFKADQWSRKVPDSHSRKVGL